VQEAGEASAHDASQPRRLPPGRRSTGWVRAALAMILGPSALTPQRKDEEAREGGPGDERSATALRTVFQRVGSCAAGLAAPSGSSSRNETT